MDRMFNWIKEHKKTSVAILFGLFIIPIVVVHFLFKWKSNIYWIQADWDSGDVLAYIGGFYAFLGTVIFSMLALWQNHQIEKKNEEYNEQLQKIETKLNMPLFDIPYSENCEQGCDGNYANLCFKLRNISPNLALQIKISNFEIYDETGKKTLSSKSVKINDTVLSANTTINVKFTNDNLQGKNLSMIFYIDYQDKYYNKHKIKATGAIADAKTFESIIFNLIEMEDTQNA